MHRRISTLLAVGAPVALAVVGAAVLGSGQPAQSQAGRTLTFTELEKGATFTHVRNTKSTSERANPQGDLIVFTNPVADASGAVVGKLHVTCTTTVGARNFVKSTLTCLGIVGLRDGTLTVSANTSPVARTTTGAVIGGTGAYVNATGVYVSKGAKGGSQTTINLEG